MMTCGKCARIGTNDVRKMAHSPGCLCSRPIPPTLREIDAELDLLLHGAHAGIPACEASERVRDLRVARISKSLGIAP